jgi:hypothetical protein
VAFGANPTATTSSAYLAANTPYYFECDPSDKVAVIQNAAGGNLFVTKLG